MQHESLIRNTLQSLYTRGFLLFSLLVLFGHTQRSSAQSAPVIQGIRRLPPSLERELRIKRGGKARIIGFTDTLKAQSIIAQSIRDSSLSELDSTNTQDSAIVMVDSSVSLTHKEWLDSMLSELPEYRSTVEGIRFQYPVNILVETNRKVVPFDSTLPTRMDPVSKEDLPLYDLSPLPRPLRQLGSPKTSVEIGIGLPYLPTLAAESLLLNNQFTMTSCNGKFRTTGASDPASKQFWRIGVEGSFLFPSLALPKDEQSPKLDITASSGANKRRFISATDSGLRSLAGTLFIGQFTVGSLTQLLLHSDASLSFLKDDIAGGSFERQGRLGLTLEKNIFDSNFQVRLDLQFHGASSIQPRLLTLPMSLLKTRLTIDHIDENPIRWGVGLSYSAGGDASGSISSVGAIVSASIQVFQGLEIGAGFEPTSELVGIQQLTNKNLFYSPVAAAAVLLNDALFPDDQRRIVTEPIHLNVFANYFLSTADELHVRFHFIERQNEPTFQSGNDSKRHIIFVASPKNTRRIEIELGGHLILFTKDFFSTSMFVRAADELGNGNILPFEPTIQFDAIYQFKDISDKLNPEIELKHLERPFHSSTFLNLGAEYLISNTLHLRFHADNILGSSGDFWTGYDEYPREISLSARYSF